MCRRMTFSTCKYVLTLVSLHGYSDHYVGSYHKMHTVIAILCSHIIVWGVIHWLFCNIFVLVLALHWVWKISYGGDYGETFPSIPIFFIGSVYLNISFKWCYSISLTAATVLPCCCFSSPCICTYIRKYVNQKQIEGKIKAKQTFSHIFPVFVF